MSKVEISRSLLIGLVAVASGAALGLAFLLGRATVPAVRAGAGQASGPAPAPSAGAPAGPAPAPVPAPSAGAPAPSPAAPSAPVPRDSPERAAVAAYFKAVETLQPASGGDPEAVAMQVASGLGSGDTSGVDGMIRQARDTRGRLAALVPPGPCAAYHQELLASLDEGLDLMQGLKRLVSAPDPAGLAAEITRRASAMKARSESLQNLEKSLKQRYGP